MSRHFSINYLCPFFIYIHQLILHISKSKFRTKTTTLRYTINKNNVYLYIRYYITGYSVCKNPVDRSYARRLFMTFKIGT